MSNIERMYAVPTNPWSYSPEELAQSRADLQHAEREAAAATDWGDRTRWEQEAKSLRARIAGAEIQEQVEARHEAVNRAMPHQEALVKGVEDGRYMPTKPYWGVTANTDQQQQGQPASATELEKLTAAAAKLQAVVDDATVDVQTRTKAQLALTPLRLRIEQIVTALNPVTKIGAPATAGQNAANASMCHGKTGTMGG